MRKKLNLPCDIETVQFKKLSDLNKRKNNSDFKQLNKEESTRNASLPQSVAGLIFSPDRKSILLTKRRDVPVWVFPGGGVEPNESAQEAIQREIAEETGFIVKVERLVGNYTPINRLAKHTHLYECSIISGKASVTSETKAVQFFPLFNLPLLPPPYPDWLQDAQLNSDPIEKKIVSVTYGALLKNLFLHPILVTRFLFARMGFPINTD